MQAGADQDGSTRLVEADLFTDLALGKDDPDQFGYEGLAARLADLAVAGRPPLSIAVFGPWGSGKSSLAELVRRELEGRTGFVRYDAWRYGGTALRRNFIAHAARELRLPMGRGNRAFHRGLFENRRVVELSPPRIAGALRAAVSLIPLVLLVLALGTALVGMIDWLIDDQAWERARGALVTGTLAVGGLLFLVKFFADAGRIEIDQSRPSEDDQFSATFERLLLAATRPAGPGSGMRANLVALPRGVASWLRARTRVAQARIWWRGPDPEAEPERHDRVVFFIDELDRCREQDVVATLNAIRTFLEVPRCVFIVAVDRDVIERALCSIDQASPARPVDPYYSTAGAFLDKIFHHQIHLPPLRGRRLSGWAREAALDRDAGVWAELAGPDRKVDDPVTPTLDDVLLNLIPSHVRSPRRVKVLMNAYATAARILRTRVPDAWPDQAVPLARLTALRVEFPMFAADLRQEPRLPRLLLEGPPPRSDLARELVKKWDFESGADPDPVIERRDEEEGDEEESEQETAVLAQRRRQFQRFIERTSATPDITRSLLYLDATGYEVGIRDPELGELIEREATDSPNAVLDAVRERDVGEQQGAARLLAAMVQEVLRPERVQVMSALMGVSELLGEASAPVAAEIANALRAYRVASPLEDDQLPGALRNVLTAEGPSSELVSELLELDALWSDQHRFLSVLAMVDELAANHASTLEVRLAEVASGWPEVVMRIAREADGSNAITLLDNEVLEQFVSVDETGSLATRLGDLADGLLGRGESTVCLTILRRLLDAAPEQVYELVDSRWNHVTTVLEPAAQTTLLFTAWTLAARDDWDAWTERTQALTRSSDDRAARLLLASLEAAVEPDAQPDDYRAMVEAVTASVVEFDPDKLLDPVRSTFTLDASWQTDENAAAQRVDLHQLLAVLAEAAPPLHDRLDELSSAALAAALRDQPISVTSHLPTIRSVAPLLTGASVDALLDDMPDWSALEGEELAPWLETVLALHLNASVVDVNAVRVMTNRVVALAGWFYRSRPAEVWGPSARIIALWLRANPAPGEVSRVGRAMQGRRSKVVQDALGAWARTHQPSERLRQRGNSAVVVALMKTKQRNTHFVASLRQGGLVETRIVATARELILDVKTSIREREAVADMLVAARLDTRLGRSSVGKLIREILELRRYTHDIDLALRMMPVLHAEYDGVAPLNAALTKRLRREDRKLKPQQATLAANAGLVIDAADLTSKGSKAYATAAGAAREAGRWFTARIPFPR